MVHLAPGLPHQLIQESELITALLTVPLPAMLHPKTPFSFRGTLEDLLGRVRSPLGGWGVLDLLAGDHSFPPEPYDTIGAGRGEEEAVGAEVDGGDGFGVAGEGADLLTGADLIELDGVILTTRCEELAVRAEADRPDFVGVAGEGAEFLTGAELPEFDGVVGTARGEELTTRAEADGAYPGGVAGEGAEFLTGAEPPEFDGVVSAA